MKILITTDCYTPTVNGVVTSIVTIETELRRKGHDVRVLCPSSDIHCSFDGTVFQIGSFGAGKIYKGARVAFRVSKRNLTELIRWKPDIIHSQSEFTSFITAKKIASAVKCPIIHTYHTVYENYTHYFSPNMKIGKQTAKVFTRQIISHVQSVIAPSAKVKEMLTGYGISKPINIIPTGLDFSRFQNKPTKEDTDKLKAELNIPEGNRVLITVGRTAKEKNIDELLHYFKELNNPMFTLLIVGGGPYLNELICLSKELGISDKVRFTGMVQPNRISEYYALGDIFVSASTSETQGLTYIEAMACGLPLICKNDTCLNDVINIGENGFCYQDFNEFSSAVYSLCENNAFYLKASENALKKSLSYSNSTFAESVITAYNNTISDFRIGKDETYETKNALHYFKNCG